VSVTSSRCHCGKRPGQRLTEVVGSTLQSIEEIRVLLEVGIDKGTIGKDDLEVDDIVASKAIHVGQVGKTSLET
jgi:hypothetical protein